MTLTDQTAAAPAGKRDPMWHHRATLEAKRNGTKPPPIYDGQPECGYYERELSKGGPRVAAAIWHEKEEPRDRDVPWLVCRVGNETRYMVCRIGSDMRDPVKAWTWLAGRNIEQDEANFFFQHGSWRGVTAPEPAEADAGGRVGAPAPSDQPAGIGDNSRNAPEPPADPAAAEIAALARTVEGAREWLKGIGGKIKDDVQKQTAANKVGTLRDEYGKLKKRHKAEKADIIEAGRVLDAKYLRPMEKGEAAAKQLLDLIAVYGDEQNRKAEEERRKVEEEHARQAAAAKKAKEPPPPPPPPPAPAPITKVASMTGRAISVGTKPDLFLTDATKLLRAYKDDYRLREALMVLARADWKQTSKVPPGTEVRQVPKAA